MHMFSIIIIISHVHRIVTCGIVDQHRSPVADRIFMPYTKYESRKGAVALHTISSILEIEFKPIYNANSFINTILTNKLTIR